MKQKEKAHYVKEWTSYVQTLHILGMNSPDKELSKKLFSLLDELVDLIPKIADAKIQASKGGHKK